MKFILSALVMFLAACHKPVAPEIVVVPHPVAIEINSVPSPFDMNGHNPYVVWMNGKRVQLPKKDLLLLVDKVGQENIPSLDTRDIHRGWLFPYFADAEENFPNTE